MSTPEHLELAEAMAVTHTGPAGLELVYAPLGGPRTVPPYEELDPGVRETVRWLFEHGFNPTGDGVSKVGKMGCARPIKHVYMVVAPSDTLENEVDRLYGLLLERGVRLFDGPSTPEEAEELGVRWEGVPEGVVPGGSLQGSYAPGGPGIIMLEGVDDVVLGLRDGA